MLRATASTLGLLALIAAAVVGMLASVGVFGEKAPASLRSGACEADALKQAERTAAGVGEAVRTGDVSWTVTDARRTTELHKRMPPPETKHGNFVVVSFTVENVSEQPVTLTEESAILFDQEGRKCPAHAWLNSGILEPEKNILFNERSLLDPGETEEGRVNFLVQEDSSGFKVLFGDTDPTADEERYVDLSF